MNEKQLFQKVIEENIIKKESIRHNVIATVRGNSNKGVVNMKKRVFVSVIVLMLVSILSISTYAAVDVYQYNQASAFFGELGIASSSLTRSDVKKVYKDIKSDAFEYTTTFDVLNSKAVEMGIEEIPSGAKEIYQAIVEYHGLISTAKIVSAQIKAIKAGTSYKDIIKALGNTKDVGSGRHVLQYAVDGDKIFYLSFADENDICSESSEELLKTLVDAKQDNVDENTFNATLTQRSGNNILVSCPTYKNFDVISLTITDDTIIVFENGKKATIDDIKGDLTITITGRIRESYPPQSDATKIVVR